MQAVVGQQDDRRARGGRPDSRRAARASRARRRAAVGERHGEPPALDPVAGRVPVRALRERRDLVEQVAREGDHPRAAHRVVVGAALAAAVLGDRVGAVERVVQAAPARIGGVQRVARVGHRHHELRAGDGADLGIDVGGAWRRSPGPRARDSRSPRGSAGRPPDRTALPRRSRCQASICACSSSRRASSARLRGASSATIAASAAQNRSAATPVPGSASSLMKSCSARATARPRAWILSVMTAVLPCCVRCVGAHRSSRLRPRAQPPPLGEQANRAKALQSRWPLARQTDSTVAQASGGGHGDEDRRRQPSLAWRAPPAGRRRLAARRCRASSGPAGGFGRLARHASADWG